MKLNKKQTKALDYLEDDVTNEVEYGGGAGGGKSILLCYWQIKRRLKFPGTRGLIGRSSLKTLKETTLNSFFEVCRIQGLKSGTHFNFNQQSNIITFYNGSIIFLKDLFQYPSDPNFDELGSLEITDAGVDENNQTVEKAWNIVKSRIRYKLDYFCHICANQEKSKVISVGENGSPTKWICGNGHLTGGLIPKMLGCCNPAKGWIYNKFYKPYKDGTLPESAKFIQALVGDNPDISAHYRANLLSLDEVSKQRLLYGNWEYDDDPATLIPYDKILDCFTNKYVPDGERFITADIARFGSDSTVIGVWNGYKVQLHQYKGKSVTEVAGIIKQLQQREGVGNSNTIVDEDGVGGGVVDTLRCKGFVNNSRALPNPNAPYTDKGEKPVDNFANLKSQCYYKLAEFINFGKLYIFCNDVAIKSSIIQELEQVKRHNVDKDGKQQVVPKDKVKEIIGRSPDFSDALMMRMWFEFAPKRVFAAAQY